MNLHTTNLTAKIYSVASKNLYLDTQHHRNQNYITRKNNIFAIRAKLKKGRTQINYRTSILYIPQESIQWLKKPYFDTQHD